LVSFSEVRPLETISVRAKDFMHLLRRAADEEKTDFFKKLSENLKLKAMPK